jgi:hypothetical protein
MYQEISIYFFALIHELLKSRGSQPLGQMLLADVFCVVHMFLDQSYLMEKVYFYYKWISNGNTSNLLEDP